ncbi:low temperature requirement protein A [Streptomyces sp. NPDC014861]|uniref:low temperature requirement protein A n=1 Tax=Streptomyces sp. NPDC014861 TaxID=3364923 RepID=UPI0036FA72EC
MSQQQSTGPSWAWYRPMTARPAGEKHRTATVLELFFDLCFVTAVAQAAAAFEHEVAEGHIGHGVLGYALVFFAIWWAWMNFTWFASAYDTDDVPYRLLTLVQITGALIMAAGAAKALKDYDFTVITWGYVVMRLAMAAQWMRAARADTERRQCCVRYAVGILLVQAGWVGRLALPDDGGLPVFAVLALAELAVPVWAEQTTRTTWHPHHIAERYGLFTIIVLGESITAATAAVRTALDTDTSFSDIAPVTVGGLLTVFAMWWLYFSQNASGRLTAFRAALRWGYGHYAIFASGAAVGAGLAVGIAQSSGHAHISDNAAAAAYTLPVAVFVTVLWLLHRSPGAARGIDIVWGVAVLAILAVTLAPSPVLITGIITSVLVAVVLAADSRIRRSRADMRENTVR